MLIIGLGNPDRGDDAAGILVARRLRECGIDAVEHTSTTLDLLDVWAASDRVIVADAVISRAAAGSIQVWDPWKLPLENAIFRASTHEFSLADTIELARALNRLPHLDENLRNRGGAIRGRSAAVPRDRFSS